MQSRIVQAEFFFHAGDMLDDTIAEVNSRISDGAPIKRTVRFYQTPLIATHVEHEIEAHARHQAILGKVHKRKGLRRRFTWWQQGRAFGRLYCLKQRRLEVARSEVTRLFREGDMVMHEQDDRRYKIVPRNERHELVEAIRKATYVWLFVFSADDLNADKLENMQSAI